MGTGAVHSALAKENTCCSIMFLCESKVSGLGPHRPLTMVKSGSENPESLLTGTAARLSEFKRANT